MIHYVTASGVGNAWVANELSRVQAAGVPFIVHALRRPERLQHGSPWALRMNAETRAVYPVAPVSLLVSVMWAPFLFRARFFAAFANALLGEREHLRARLAGIWHLFVAAHWARALRSDAVSHVHSQWIHACGTVAMYGAWLLGVPFSFTGHAADLFRERCALRDKIRRARFIVCISEFHRRFFLEQGARPEQLFIAYCGIDLSWFYPRAAAPQSACGIRILSSGRLVEKKGFAVLIDACRVLAQEGRSFECVIAGDGPLEAQLRERVERLGLADRVRLTGKALLQEEIVSFMHQGDVYALPCVWAADGDVDGLPQMLMEAMACGLPAVSTRLVGIPDLIREGQTGLLVEPNDAIALAGALARLMDDPALRERFALAGRRWVAERFDLDRSLEPLIQRYRECLGLAATPAGARGGAAEAAHASQN